MKKLSKKTTNKIKVTALSLVCLALLVSGVAGTLAYQNFLANVRAEGAAEFVLEECSKFTNKDKTEQWLECEVQ